ncbi:MAG: GFA family protein, partial [Caulobacteraceae bacterium]|nr:GFA family protein [Caulobacteraceae bacterium]
MIEGSCLCGAVAYQADALAGPIVHCHCRTCQKAHSAAFATTARVARDQFRWTRGGDVLAAFESTPGKLRRFCTRCGSQMISEWVDQPMVILRIATVEHGLDA